MCIRDSPNRRLLDEELHRAVRETPHTGERIALLMMDLDQFKDCLLYTSDAADERSSVDLGGRRIIKKKNNNTLN